MEGLFDFAAAPLRVIRLGSQRMAGARSAETMSEAQERRVEWWAGKDLHLGRRKPPDLQSGPFDCFGTDPRLK